eukprot:tig00000076_g2368.t1
MVSFQEGALKAFLLNALAPIADPDADPAQLTDYIVELLKNNPERELRALCERELKEFITSGETEPFVELLFSKLADGSYLEHAPAEPVSGDAHAGGAVSSTSAPSTSHTGALQPTRSSSGGGRNRDDDEESDEDDDRRHSRRYDRSESREEDKQSSNQQNGQQQPQGDDRGHRKRPAGGPPEDADRRRGPRSDWRGGRDGPRHGDRQRPLLGDGPGMRGPGFPMGAGMPYPGGPMRPGFGPSMAGGPAAGFVPMMGPMGPAGPGGSFPRPPFMGPGGPGGREQSSSGASSQRCRDYDERGVCRAGDRCPYQHGEEAIRVPMDGLAFVPPVPFRGPVPGPRDDRFRRDGPPPMGGPHGRPPPDQPPRGMSPAGPNVPPPGMDAPGPGEPPREPPAGPPGEGGEEYDPERPAVGMPPRERRRAGRGGRGGGRGGGPGDRGGDRGDRGPRGEGEGQRPDRRTLEVAKIPRNLMDRRAIGDHFSRFGAVLDVTMIAEREGEAGRALVTFNTGAEARAAIRSPEAVCGNRFIFVLWPIERVQEEQGRKFPPLPPDVARARQSPRGPEPPRRPGWGPHGGPPMGPDPYMHHGGPGPHRGGPPGPMGPERHGEEPRRFVRTSGPPQPGAPQHVRRVVATSTRPPPPKEEGEPSDAPAAGGTPGKPPGPAVVISGPVPKLERRSDASAPPAAPAGPNKEDVASLRQQIKARLDMLEKIKNTTMTPKDRAAMLAQITAGLDKLQARLTASLEGTSAVKPPAAAAAVAATAAAATPSANSEESPVTNPPPL